MANRIYNSTGRAIRYWFLRRLPDCKELSIVMSESLERPLTWRERFPLTLHFLVCEPCFRYLQHLKFMRRILRHESPRDERFGGGVFVNNDARTSTYGLQATGGFAYALKNHWPEYLIEAAGLCVFMISACMFAALFFHPSSPVNHRISSPAAQRVMMGLAMGLTAISIIYSPWGKRSGAHINPSTTLTFFRLGKVAPWDALFYTLAQFAGGITGVLISALLLGNIISAPSVNYVTTVPGTSGLVAAFMAEVLISFILMTAILFASNNASAARWTGVIAGILVAAYISIESPISGTSMNPARSFGSAFSAGMWTALWVYFTAPPVGMLLAAEAYTRARSSKSVMCAKLHHRNNQRCIFRCGYKSV